MKRLVLIVLAGVLLAAGIALAQVPPVGTGGIGGAIPVAASSGNVAAATAAASLPGTTGKLTYITGFQMTAGGSTAVSSVTCTVSPVGTAGATLSYTFSSAATVDSPSPSLVVNFNPPLPANAAMSAQGFQH